MIGRENIFFAGQITGVEGYVESIASGLSAGINAVKFMKKEEQLVFPEETILRLTFEIYINSK